MGNCYHFFFLFKGLLLSWQSVSGSFFFLKVGRILVWSICPFGIVICSLCICEGRLPMGKFLMSYWKHCANFAIWTWGARGCGVFPFVCVSFSFYNFFVCTLCNPTCNFICSRLSSIPRKIVNSSCIPSSPFSGKGDSNLCGSRVATGEMSSLFTGTSWIEVCKSSRTELLDLSWEKGVSSSSPNLTMSVKLQ